MHGTCSHFQWKTFPAVGKPGAKTRPLPSIALSRRYTWLPGMGPEPSAALYISAATGGIKADGDRLRPVDFPRPCSSFPWTKYRALSVF